jgi:hypothetical protein
MVTTKRYDYVPIDQVRVHPLVGNHRALDDRKVAHYHDDILKNGLLEPLVVWERASREYFLVGGFHRLAAIQRIRAARPGWFDRVDVRVVAGDVEEIRALNLKLNADRLDAKVCDYFDTILFLNNANWSVERIATFLDKGMGWVEDILRYVPGMDPRVRALLHAGAMSWGKAKQICRRMLAAPAGEERATVDTALAELERGGDAEPRYVLTPKKAERKLSKHPQEFGTTGAIEGVAGPEAANNSAVTATLVPLLTLGIPTSVTAAILLSALQNYGIQAGPQLFDTSATLVWALIASLYIGNVMLLVLNLPLVGLWVKLLKVPRPQLYAGILIFATVGVYGMRQSAFDLYLMFGVGLVGVLMRRFDFPVAPVIVGMILGPLAEAQMRNGLSIGEGRWTVFVERPASATLLGVVVLLLSWPLIRRLLRR